MTRPWEDIVKTFQERIEGGLKVQFMLNFVKEIMSSNYASGLYAWTSMHDMCIVQNAVKYPYDGPTLIISPIFNGTVEFRYIDTHIKERQWNRTVNENELFPTLEKFIEQLHWHVNEN